MTEQQQNARAVALASRAYAICKRRLEILSARAESGHASAKQLADAIAACKVSSKALSGVKRRYPVADPARRTPERATPEGAAA